MRVHFVYQKSLHTYFLFYTTILDSGLRFALGSTGEAKIGHYVMFAKYIISIAYLWAAVNIIRVNSNFSQ